MIRVAVVTLSFLGIAMAPLAEAVETASGVIVLVPGHGTCAGTVSNGVGTGDCIEWTNIKTGGCSGSGCLMGPMYPCGHWIEAYAILDGPSCPSGRQLDADLTATFPCTGKDEVLGAVVNNSFPVFGRAVANVSCTGPGINVPDFALYAGPDGELGQVTANASCAPCAGGGGGGEEGCEPCEGLECDCTSNDEDCEGEDCEGEGCGHEGCHCEVLH